MIVTSELRAPGTGPLIAMTRSSLFTRTSGTCLRVIPSRPICQCIFCPGLVRRGFRLPIEPSALWNLEPWEAGPPEKFQRFIAP